MHRTARKALTALALAAGLAASGHLVVQATAAPASLGTTVNLARYASQPAEDSPRFDCRYHGNRVCGTRFDPRPSDGKAQAVWVLVTYRGNPAQPVAVRTR